MPTPPPWCSADPGRAAGGVEQRVEQRPVATPRRCRRASLRSRGWAMATEPESRWSRPITIGAFSSPAAHHLVEGQAGAVALAQAEPADARRQALERDALARHVEPAVQVRVVGEQLLHLGVGLADVFRVAGQRHPAERPACRGRTAGGCRPARSRGSRRRSSRRRPARPGGCCCRSRPSARPSRGSRASPARAPRRTRAAASRSARVLATVLPARPSSRSTLQPGGR